MPDRPTVLLVENASAPRTLRTLLERRGCIVHVVQGSDALAHVDVQPFDLVVMDADLAGPTSPEAIRRLRFREEDGGWHTPVLVVNDAGEEHQAAGADACLAKPYRPEDLVELVDGALSMYQPASENLPPPEWLEDEPTG